jgi:hypothetical protein
LKPLKNIEIRIHKNLQKVQHVSSTHTSVIGHMGDQAEG